MTKARFPELLHSIYPVQVDAYPMLFQDYIRGDAPNLLHWDAAIPDVEVEMKTG